MQHQNLSVSIIVPTYNRREMLLAALQSVLQQSVRSEEILVVDDASTDGSREYIFERLGQPTKTAIRWLRLTENQGPAAARNHGVHHARCGVVAFLDSDDRWHPRKLEKQMAMMERYPAFLISHTREKWLRNGQHLNQKNKHIPRHGDIFSQCLALCAVGMSTVMLRMKIFETIGVFDESMRCCEDYDFWLRASCRFPFLLVDEALTIKEGGREDQVSRQYRVGMDRWRIDALRRMIADDYLDENRKRQALQILLKKCEIFGRGCLKHGKEADGRQYLAYAEEAAQKLMRTENDGKGRIVE